MSCPTKTPDCRTGHTRHYPRGCHALQMRLFLLQLDVDDKLFIYIIYTYTSCTYALYNSLSKKSTEILWPNSYR